MPNYKSFDDVLNELGMDDDELKRLVSEGQIRAFRDDDRMKFRSEDVQSLARQRHSSSRASDGDIDIGETQLGGEGLEIIEEETDETMLDLGSFSNDADFEDTGATSVPTVELSDIGEDQDATLTEELVFDETDELGGLDFGDEDADETQKIEGELDLSSDDDLGLETEPIVADDLDELDELDGLEDEPADVIDDEPAYAPPALGMGAPVQIQEQIRYVEIVPNEGVLWKVLTGITFILVMVLLITPPAMGMIGGRDVVSPFWGDTGHSLYGKGPNPSTHITQQAYETPGPKAFSVSANPNQVAWPGMEIIRKVEGYGLTSAHGTSIEE